MIDLDAKALEAAKEAGRDAFCRCTGITARAVDAAIDAALASVIASLPPQSPLGATGWQGTFADIDGHVMLTGIYDGRGEPLMLQGEKAAADYLKEMRDELQGHRLSLKLRHDADMRAIEMWQQAHPGNDLTWPDHADLVVWLLERIDRPGADRAGWQPIETAPKDGTDILAWVPDEVYLKPRFYAIVRSHNNQWTREGDDYDLVVEPTHWQPLPASPKESR